MTHSTPIEVCFSTTQNYLKYYTPLARSIAENLDGRKLKIHILYSTNYGKLDDKEWQNTMEMFQHSLADMNCEICYYDITDQTHIFDNQNTGMWGKKTSLTHYYYLLAPRVLKNSKRMIYLDGDMICTTSLADVFDIDMTGKMIAMAEHSGGDLLSEKELSPTASNAGFSVWNLDLWRKNNIIDDIVQFGTTVPHTGLCVQALLYFYFGREHPDWIMYVDKKYNMFPSVFPEIPTEDIAILHFTAYGDPKPWSHFGLARYRGADIWWKYARKTAFYECFIAELFERRLQSFALPHQKSRGLRRLWKHIKKMKF